MSVAEVRVTLANAANEVDGVAVAPRFRQYARTGDGSVRLDRVARSDNGFGWVATWQVWVLCPQDLDKAEEWIDERALALADALAPHLLVASVSPQQLNIGSKSVPCLVVEGTREAE